MRERDRAIAGISAKLALAPDDVREKLEQIRPPRWTDEWKAVRKLEADLGQDADRAAWKKVTAVWVPDGIVPRCKICFAAWPGSHCDECLECGLGPQLDPMLQWVADRAAQRTERRAELQRWVLESCSDEDENEDALETRGAMS